MVIECKELNKFLASNYKDYLKQLAVPDKQEIGYYSDNYIVQYPMQVSFKNVEIKNTKRSRIFLN